MKKSSEDKLAKVHPELASRIRLAASALLDQGITIEVVQGLRTYAEQNALYAQGRTKPGKQVTNARGGQSNHNFGLAVDVCPFVKGEADWDADDTIWDQIGDAGKAEGLEWGGDWVSIIDKPHLQIPGLSLAECRTLYAAGGLPKVWAAVNLNPPAAPEPIPVATAAATSTTTTTITTPEETKTVTERKESLIEALGVPEAAKDIAKSGVTQLGTATATTLGTAGVGAGLKAFIDGHLTELIFAAFLIALAVTVVIVVIIAKHKTKQKVIDVNADKTKNDVRLL